MQIHKFWQSVDFRLPIRYKLVLYRVFLVGIEHKIADEIKEHRGSLPD